MSHRPLSWKLGNGNSTLSCGIHHEFIIQFLFDFEINWAVILASCFEFSIGIHCKAEYCVLVQDGTGEHWTALRVPDEQHINRRIQTLWSIQNYNYLVPRVCATRSTCWPRAHLLLSTTDRSLSRRLSVIVISQSYVQGHNRYTSSNFTSFQKSRHCDSQGKPSSIFVSIVISVENPVHIKTRPGP